MLNLEDEASELVRYIKRKEKAVEVWDKETAVSGSRWRYIKEKGKVVEVQDKEAVLSGGGEKVAGARKGIK